MVSKPLLFIHILMGSLALLSGAVALSVRKGEQRHRGFGNLFFVAMLGMSASGAILAWSNYERINIVVGILTFYLVATAWVTVKREEGRTGLFEIFAFPVAFVIGVWGWVLGVEVLDSELGYIDGEDVPAGAYFVFGSVAILASLLDIKLLLSKGLFGKQRIARHLWRMCFAMLIAVASFFLGQAQIFPEAIQDFLLLAIPVLLILILLVFWTIRVLFTKWYQ